MRIARYQANEAMNFFMQMASMSTFMASSQMRMATLWMQPWLNSTLGYYDRNPVTLKVQGLRKLAALNPAFKATASRFPDSIAIQYGLGPTPELQRDYDNVSFILNAARPDKNLRAAAYVTNLQATEHPKADYNSLVKGTKIDTVLEGNGEDLIRFQPTNGKSKGVKFIVAPMSGHYSTLVTSAIQANTDAGYTVYLNDLHNAADKAGHEEPHDMDSQVTDKISSLKKIHEIEGVSPDVAAICQGGIPMLIAVAKLCKDGADHKPKSFAFMSGPGDVSVTKSIVNEMGESMPYSFFDNWAVSNQLASAAGKGINVRSGQQQVDDFMKGNPGRHMSDLAKIMNFVARQGSEWSSVKPLTQANIIEKLEQDNLDHLERGFLTELMFRTEYMTSADQDAASFLDAIRMNFKGNFFANGTAAYQGDLIDLKAIDIPFLTVDAEKDDISTIGQSMGLHPLLGNQSKQSALIIPDKGHFWWAGKTAAEIHWPRIMKWQDSPEKSGVPDFSSEMIDNAKTTHAANMAAEQRKVTDGAEFSITSSHLGVTVPIAGYPRPSISLAA